jgi:hypothetical protein
MNDTLIEQRIDACTGIDALVAQRISRPDGYRPRVLRPQVDGDAAALRVLLVDPQIDVHDTLLTQLGELVKVVNPRRAFDSVELAAAARDHLGDTPPGSYGVWVYYPWARRVVHLLDEAEFVAVRTSRNHYKITPAEQVTLAAKHIGVVGLSVGQTIALALAMERTCGEIRLADFDTLELSNLNRVRTGVGSLGLPKAVATAREIAELDPFLPVTCFLDGITQATVDPFLAGLDLLVEVCDSLDIKLLARQHAKAAGIPVVMQTSDRGMLDVERFDREPERPLLHGLIEHLDAASLQHLSNEQKVPFILAMLGIDTTSDRLKASMLEVEQTIPTWPQLAGAVMLGGAAVSDVARRIFLDEFGESGRFFVDLEGIIANRNATARQPLPPPESPPVPTAEQMVVMVEKLALPGVQPDQRLDREDITRLVAAATSAPSGGNAQPWQWLHHRGRLYLFFDRSRGSFIDVASTASSIAMGAAVENLILETHTMGLHVQVQQAIVESQPPIVAFTFARDAKALAAPEPCQFDHLASAIPLRTTNRSIGPRRPIDPDKLVELQEVTRSVVGADLAYVTSDAELDEFATIASAAERLRVLDPSGHQDFTREIRWTTAEAQATGDGIDLATIDLTETERAGLSVARSWPVVAAMKRWDGGGAFERLTRKAIDAASCVGLLTMPTWCSQSFFDGGRALQRLWLTATQLGVAVQPVASSTFLFARLLHGGGAGLDPAATDELHALRQRFELLFPVVAHQCGEVLLIRLAIAPDPQTSALRRPIGDVLTFVEDHSFQQHQSPRDRDQMEAS